MNVLLDTCALLWITVDPHALSVSQRRKADRALREGAAVSSISVWEIGVKLRKGTLDLGMPLDEYVARVRSLGSIEFIAVDERIWCKAAGLDWEHRDPADRVIVATALLYDVPVATRDDIIRGYYPKQLW